MCHAQCEHCGHPEVADLDLVIHQSGDGKFSLAAECREPLACTVRTNARLLAREVLGVS